MLGLLAGGGNCEEMIVARMERKNLTQTCNYFSVRVWLTGHVCVEYNCRSSNSSSSNSCTGHISFGSG